MSSRHYPQSHYDRYEVHSKDVRTNRRQYPTKIYANDDTCKIQRYTYLGWGGYGGTAIIDTAGYDYVRFYGYSSYNRYFSAFVTDPDNEIGSTDAYYRLGGPGIEHDRAYGPGGYTSYSHSDEDMFVPVRVTKIVQPTANSSAIGTKNGNHDHMLILKRCTINEFINNFCQDVPIKIYDSADGKAVFVVDPDRSTGYANVFTHVPGYGGDFGNTYTAESSVGLSNREGQNRDGFTTGAVVTLAGTGLPDGITAGTEYYYNRLTNSRGSLSATQADVDSEVILDIADEGSGSDWTMSVVANKGRNNYGGNSFCAAPAFHMSYFKSGTLWPANGYGGVHGGLEDTPYAPAVTLGAIVSTTNNTLTVADHKFTVGSRVQVSVSEGGSIPTGLAASTNYYIDPVDKDTIKFCASKEHCTTSGYSSNNSATHTHISLSSQGSGTLTLTSVQANIRVGWNGGNVNMRSVGHSAFKTNTYGEVRGYPHWVAEEGVTGLSTYALGKSDLKVTSSYPKMTDLYDGGDHQLESRSVSGYIANSYDDDILYTGDYDTANSLAPYGITTGYVDSHNGSPTSPTYSNFSGYVVDPPKSMRVSLSGVDDNYTYTWHLIVEMHKRGSRGEARPFIDHNKGA